MGFYMKIKNTNILIRVISSFFQWQGEFFLGERTFHAQSEYTRNRIIDCLKSRINTQKPREKIIFSIENNIFFIKIKPLFIGKPIYMFKAKVIERDGPNTVFGEYKMKLFPKAFLLFWFNVITLFLFLFVLKGCFDIYQIIIGSEELYLFGILIPIIGGATTLTFGFFVVRIIQSLHSPRIILSLFDCFFEQ
jgi:hypothetical protein